MSLIMIKIFNFFIFYRSTPFEEVSKDIISIMNIYVAKVNGMRKYKKPINDVKKCFKENCK